MTERVMGFEPVLAPPQMANPAVVTVPERRERGLSRGVSRWLCLVVADAVAVAVSTVVVLRYSGETVAGSLAVVAVMVVSFLAALAASGSYGRYAEGLIVSRQIGRPGVLYGLPLAVVLASLAGRASVPDGAGGLGLEQAALVAVLGLAAIPAARLLVPSLIAPRRRVRRVLIVGTGRVAARVEARLRRCSDVSVVGVVDDDPRDASAVLGVQAELPDLCARYGVDAVVVAFSRRPAHETLESLRGLDSGVSVWVVPRLYELMSWRSAIEELHGIPLLDVAPAQVGTAARAGKRILDVVVAGTLLIILSPLFAAVAASI
jgi:FlaA1/EpsC-like NDP-sugar epimerase